MLSTPTGLLAISLAVASTVLLLLMGFDKLAAVRGWRRTPERTLHLWALLGGWPGGWLGQRLFRHKTAKRAFRCWFRWSVLGHLVLLCLAYWALQRVDCC